MYDSEGNRYQGGANDGGGTPAMGTTSPAMRSALKGSAGGMSNASPTQNIDGVGGGDHDDFSPFTCVPVLSQRLHEAFAGSHTQFASVAYFTRGDSTLVSCVVVVTCTQLFICDLSSYVHRTVLVERLLSVYERPTSQAEREVLLVIDGEHDLLLRGTLLHDGEPAKPLVPTLRALHRAHHPQAPLIHHPDCPAPLRDMARLQPPAGYTAPLPRREQDFDRCPCWREADVLPISAEEFYQRVRNFFVVYHPEKLPQVADICRKYAKRKGGALQSLADKYGPEPTAEHAAAVAAVLRREARFQDIFPTAGGGGPDGAASGEAGQPSITSVFGSGRASQKRHGSSDQPLLVSTLLLLNQPTGGPPKVTIKVKAVTDMLPTTSFRAYRPAPLQPSASGGGGGGSSLTMRDDELWYLSNEGFVLPFDTSAAATRPFGYSSGDRVLSTFGVTSGRWSIVIGVRGGVLWAHDETDVGASALVGFKCRGDFERYCGWLIADRIPLRPAKNLMADITGGFVETLQISPDVMSRFGVYHGDVVASLRPCEQPTRTALVAGVGIDGLLYVRFATAASTRMEHEASGGGGGRGSTGRVIEHAVADEAYFEAEAVPVDHCRNEVQLLSRHGWQPVSAAPVRQSSRAPRASGAAANSADLQNPHRTPVQLGSAEVRLPTSQEQYAGGRSGGISASMSFGSPPPAQGRGGSGSNGVSFAH